MVFSGWVFNKIKVLKKKPQIILFFLIMVLKINIIYRSIKVISLI